MIISILTLFPELYKEFSKTSLIGRATQKGVMKLNVKNLFEYAFPKTRIDSPVFGHNSGMLLRPDIIEKAIEEQEKNYKSSYKIFFSPQGKKLDQNLLKDLASKIHQKQHLMLLPARYEGMDSRVEEYYADLIVSIGDYVLMGGDLPAMVLIEGLTRLLPEVVSNQESIANESFSGPFFDHPSYTLPVIWKGFKVPDIVRSGNHKEIFNWQRSKAIEKTIYNNFNWLRSHILNYEDIQEVKNKLPAHYVVLMHDHVLVDSDRVGASSVTSLDVHDIARSACTFGLKKYFIVTPLLDQQKIIRKLLNFWLEESGISYNITRHEAIKNVILISSLEEVITKIIEIEGKEPVLIATTAKSKEVENKAKAITYYDQDKVWSQHKPVLFVLGTARGLSSYIINSCDYLLEPIKGFSSYNHLSVRSAAAIIFDRWFGINPKNIQK